MTLICLSVKGYVRLIKEKQRGTESLRKKCSREQGQGGELNASHEPGATSKLLNFRGSGGDQTTHNVSVKAVMHTKKA